MPVRVMGIDPGLQRTGWGVVEQDGHSLKYIASGVIRTDSGVSVAGRLALIDARLSDLLSLHQPDSVAVEETFMNKNPASALKLGMARGVAILAPAKIGLDVAEYAPNLIKKSVVGSGHADKGQITAMIKMLLPGSAVTQADEADALAIAVCHAHHIGSSVMRGQAG